MDKSKISHKIGIRAFICAIVLLSLIVRNAWLKDGLFFGFEQGRDFLKLSEILSGNFTLIGPNTDIPGVFHGALSYYIPLIPFVISSGDPYAVIIFNIILHSFSIIFLYLATKDLFSKNVALIAISLYALSYSAVIYSRWLSNPNLILPLSILFFFFLVFSKRHWKYLFGLSTVMAIMVHLMVVVPIAFILPTIIFLRTERVKLTLKQIILLVIPLIIILSPYLVFEYRNGFIMTESVRAYQVTTSSPISSGIDFINQFFNEVIDGVTPTIPRLSFAVFILVFIYGVYSVKKCKNILHIITFLLSVPILFTFISNSPLRHFFITVPIFISILIAVVANLLYKNNQKIIGVTLIIVVISGNLLSLKIRLPQSEANFIHHAQRTYMGDMKAAIDYVYTDSEGNEFTYDYYSVPYWKEDAWVYLFYWYGYQRYGYSPKIDRTNTERSDIFYTIMEPNETIPVHKDNWYGEYKKNLNLLDTRNFGELVVEKRSEAK